MIINGRSYRGYLDGEGAFKAICSSYAKPPTVCKGNLEDAFVVTRENSNKPHDLLDERHDYV